MHRPYEQPLVHALAAPPIEVHLVAPAIFCWGLQRLVQSAGPQFSRVAASGSLSEALPLLEKMPPDVAVIDLDDGYGIGDVARIYANLRLKLLVLTSSSDRGFVESLLRAGARGVLQKREAPAALLKAIETVGRGGTFPRQSRALQAGEHAAAPRSPDPATSRIRLLTPRERQTIAAITSDVSAPAKVIASRLRISEHTLRNHLTSIYSKLSVSGRLALYAFSNEHGLGRKAGGSGHTDN